MKILREKLFAVLTFVLFPFIACTNEYFNDFDNYGENEYLYIENYINRIEFTQEEKYILKEAFFRMKKCIKQENKRIYVSKSADELSISEDIFYDLIIIIDVANYIDEKSYNNRIMKRSENMWDIDPCGWVHGYVNSYLEEQPGSEFSQECFNHYWEGTGNEMTVTNERFNDIVRNIKSINVNNFEIFIKDGNKYYKYTADFYNTPYALSLGQASIIYNSKSQAVGLYDEYDFNPMEWGVREYDKEAMTRAVNIAGQICDAKSFTIKYGLIK